MNSVFRRMAACLCTLLLAAFPLSAAAAPAGGGQSSPSSGIKAYGCDMSFWNVGGYSLDYSRVDFEKMKEDGCEFVILRVGYEGTGSRQNTMDDAFLKLYAQAKAAGLGVGAYFYALATTYDGAAEDAAWCIALFEQYGLSFEYPIYYDVEDPGNKAGRPGHDALNADEMTSLCLGWAQTLEAAGYFPGVYSDYETVIKLKPAYTDNYDVWYAYVAYIEGIPEFIPEEQDHSAFCGMWQYSWVGTFDGVVGDLDVNVAYKDYPTIIRTNGYNNVTPVWGNSLSVMPTYEALMLYDYNGNREGISPTYHNNGSVTFKNTVSTASWSWPSAYRVCRSNVDIAQYPLLTIQKGGTAHFNAVLSYVKADGSMGSLNLASVDGQETGEFDSGDMTITVDVQSALRQLGHLEDDNMLAVTGITYYIMGAENSYVTLQSAAFTEAPIPEAITSSCYTVEEDIVAGVTASTTVSQLLAGLDNAHYVVVRDAEGEMLGGEDTVASGMTVAIEKDGKTVKRYTLAVIGDVNGDGVVTTMDARAVLATLTTPDGLADWQKIAADFDANEAVTTADVRDLLLTVVG